MVLVSIISPGLSFLPLGNARKGIREIKIQNLVPGEIAQ